MPNVNTVMVIIPLLLYLGQVICLPTIQIKAIFYSAPHSIPLGKIPDWTVGSKLQS